MDSNRFDDVARACSPLLSRRGLAGLLGVAALATADLTDARKKRKKRKKKKNKNGNDADPKPQVKFNAFGCVNVGDFCESSGQCCSNICTNATCQAHDQITCQAGQSDFTCTSGTNIACGNNGRCLTTTGNAGFCAVERDNCVTCTKDADCVSACGQDAACVICANCPGGVNCAGPTIASCF